jgi:putative hydrolase of the HAD superfamily
MSEMHVAGVLVDLDDTLFPQTTWLSGAWHAVAAAAAPAVDPRCLEAALADVAREGSDRGRIIDRALERLGGDALDVEVTALLAAFRAHDAGTLECYPGAIDALRTLRSFVPVALVTDGDPGIQQGKIAALGLDDAFDAIVCSDELGRELRKPHPAPFRVAVEALGLDARDCVMIGDRPDKDVAGARAAGLYGTVRVRTGEYRDAPSRDCLAVVAGFAAAVAWLRPALAPAIARQTR